jgi:hypothetical protein
VAAADNYAWFFTCYWFTFKWGWKDDGSTSSIDTDDANQDDSPDDFSDAVNESDINDIPNGRPANCRDNVTCDYIGELYSDYVNDLLIG